MRKKDYIFGSTDRRGNHFKNGVWVLIEITFSALLLSFMVKVFFLDAVRIPTTSMESTLLPGDYVLVNKLIYGTKPTQSFPFIHSEFPWIQLPKLRCVERGDVIVFSLPEKITEDSPHEKLYFVKRCIAVGGDTLTIHKGVVYVNEKKMLSRGSQSRIIHSSSWNLFPNENFGSVIVPRRGSILPLSLENFDHVKHFVEQEGHKIHYSASCGITIDGNVATSYTVEQNYYFVLGDNMDQSYDSRYWGFLPEKNIIGQAMLIYWSRNPTRYPQDIWELLSIIRWSRIGTIIE